MEKWTRRKFFLATLTGGIAAGTRRLFGATIRPANLAAIADDFADSSGSAHGVVR